VRHSSHIAWPFGPCHLPTPLGLSQNRQKNRQTSSFPVDALGPVWQARVAMPECEDRFSLTRAALSASGRATLLIQFSGRVAWLLLATAFPLAAAPVIDPIPAATIAAGKSLIVPVTASSANGRPLTFTFTSSTNAIALVPHTNNPFWKLSIVQAAAANAPGAFSTSFRGGTVTVTNVGDMTFMLFPDYAPHAVSVFQGLSASGFYNSNTIFHRVIAGFMNQGGDPLTNGTGGPVFRYADEFNPQAVFSGKGQLALANSGPDTDGSQFFVTVAPFRSGDFIYTVFGQLLRGFNVLSNINNTATDSSDRPRADVIITHAGLVPDTSDTVLTLVATNRAGVVGAITVIADDGAGGRATNTFTATTITDTNINSQPFFYGNTVTNLVAPVNVTLTNFIYAFELDGYALYWFPEFADQTSADAASDSSYNLSNSVLQTLTYNVTNSQGQVQLFIKPATNYVGPVNLHMDVSSSSLWNYFGGPYDEQSYTFVFGDTPIVAQPASLAPRTTAPFTNLLLATFTNGVAGSAVTNFSAAINWGDNSITTGAITTNAAGFKQVFGAHAYTNSGDYPIYVTIQSGLGVTAVVSNTLTVRPSLTLNHTSNSNVLNWPAWAFAYQLQASTNLADPNWLAVTNISTLTGFQNAVSNPVPATKAFFRLKK
jgi:cyclophilin family peptidyl-prolyl cis-trans isomerase